MEFKKVTSTNISEIGYDESKQELQVRFSNGNLYSYSDVSKEDYDKLMEAKSVGKYFHGTIKPKYKGSKV